MLCSCAGLAIRPWVRPDLAPLCLDLLLFGFLPSSENSAGCRAASVALGPAVVSVVSVVVGVSVELAAIVESVVSAAVENYEKLQFV